jgi:hypothetical protein
LSADSIHTRLRKCCKPSLYRWQPKPENVDLYSKTL